MQSRLLSDLAAQRLHGAPPLLGVDTAPLRASGWLGWSTLLRRWGERLEDELSEPQLALFSIVHLTSASPADKDQAPQLVESPRAELAESTLCSLPELVTRLEVEAEIDLGLGLVDVLTARTSRARGADMEVAVRDDQAWADFDHGLRSLTKIFQKDSGSHDLLRDPSGSSSGSHGRGSECVLRRSLRRVGGSCMIRLLPCGGDP